MVTLLLLLGVLPLAVILLAWRFTIPSSSTDVAPTRIARRSAAEVDQSRDGSGPPRPLDSAPYDIWRQLR